LMLISLMLLLALWLLDIHYYYKMLLASVEYSEDYERELMLELMINNGGLTSCISQKISRRRAWFVSRMFYFLIGAMLVFFLIGSFLPRL